MMTGTYPTHGTQTARFLALLLDGREVGPLAGWREIGIYRLADTKLQLRKAGWEVLKETQKRPNKFGESCAFACYYLPPEVIEAAGAEGQAFVQRETERMTEILRGRREA